MCGILGGISLTPLAWLAESSRLNAAIDTLAHRGPDDRGQKIFANGRAFLAHRRLSIIDLSGGHQPISNEDGRLHFCHNGEIYNYRGLHDALAARGHTFKTKSDGETALHLYEEDPLNVAPQLDGMFALAIYDDPAGILTLIRDRLGIKPLYYYHDGNSLLFASEIKCILSMLPQRPTMSAIALREYLRWKFIPAPRTIYENIHLLPPGHTLRARRNESTNRIDVELQSYWQPDFSGEKLSNEQDVIEQLDARLQAAVRSHLEADVEIGALLSGGVDSSLVVALAARASGRRIKTFTVGFEESGFDQRPFARQVAERYQTEHFEEVVRLDPMATMTELVRQFDQPFGDSSALACYRVCQIASEHVKVVLTGDGGDEAFAGYGRYEEVLQPPLNFWQQWRHRAILFGPSLFLSPEAKFLKRYRRELLPPLERHALHEELCSDWLRNKLLTQPFRSASSDPDVFAEYHRQAAARNWSPMECAQYADLRISLPDDMLTKVDRTSMACSLECRVPLLDHHVVEFSTKIAPELKVRAGVRKYLLKKVAERYVPRELLYRPKMGFRIPVRRWMKRDMLIETASLLENGVLVSRGILDLEGVRWMMRAQQKAWIDFGSQLWALLFFEHWARLHLA